MLKEGKEKQTNNGRPKHYIDNKDWAKRLQQKPKINTGAPEGKTGPVVNILN